MGLRGQAAVAAGVESLRYGATNYAIVRPGLLTAAEEIFSVPAFAVEAQDTTGAGDSFDAGFILGWLWGLGPRESAILANALGALAASAVGAGDALPGPGKARALLQGCLSEPAWQDWAGEIGRVLDHLGCCAGR